MNNEYTFNWDIIGHEKIRKYLNYFITSSKIGHAYLFYGKENIGKRKLAHQFIKQILCFAHAKHNALNHYTFPCNRCTHCRQISKGSHPDILTVTKDNDKKNISIEQIKKMNDNLYTTSFLNTFKIALIHDAHTLSISAFNSLLKTLEEPPKKVIIILIANTLDAIPMTIRSRTQMIQCFPHNYKVLKEYLQQQKIDAPKAHDLSHLVNGESEILLSYLDDQQLLSTYLDEVQTFITILQKPLFEKFSIISLLTKKYKDSLENQTYLQQLLNIWMILLRDILLLKHDNEHYITHTMILPDLISIGKLYTDQQIYSYISEIKKIKKLLHVNINQKLALENLLINFYS